MLLAITTLLPYFVDMQIVVHEDNGIKLTTIPKIEVEFAKMTIKVKEALCKANISVATLIQQLCAISTVNTKKVPLFDEDVFDKKITSIDELWKMLTNFWTIFDYDILKLIIQITECECEEVQKIFENFLSKIDPSALDVDLVLHCEVYEEKGVLKPRLRIKVNAEKCTESIQCKVKKLISEKFDLNNYSLVSIAIKEGCVELIYYISKAVVFYLLECKVTAMMMADFAKLNIVFIQINDMKLSVPSQITSMVGTTIVQYLYRNQDTW